MTIPAAAKRFKDIAIVGFFLFLAVGAWAITFQGVTGAGVSFGLLSTELCVPFRMASPAAMDLPYEIVEVPADTANITEIRCSTRRMITYSQSGASCGGGSCAANTLTDTTKPTAFNALGIAANDIVVNAAAGDNCTVSSVTDADNIALNAGCTTFTSGDIYWIYKAGTTATLHFYQTDANNYPPSLESADAAVIEIVACDQDEQSACASGCDSTIDSATLTAARKVGFQVRSVSSTAPDYLTGEVCMQ